MHCKIMLPIWELFTNCVYCTEVLNINIPKYITPFKEIKGFLCVIYLQKSIPILKSKIFSLLFFVKVLEFMSLFFIFNSLLNLRFLFFYSVKYGMNIFSLSITDFPCIVYLNAHIFLYLFIIFYILWPYICIGSNCVHWGVSILVITIHFLPNSYNILVCCWACFPLFLKIE